MRLNSGETTVFDLPDDTGGGRLKPPPVSPRGLPYDYSKLSLD
jgi:hypothetical protein